MSATIRIFRAPDAREALEAIKAAMGPDAVIIGTREVKGGFFRKSEVEVTAALPHAPGGDALSAYARKPPQASGRARDQDDADSDALTDIGAISPRAATKPFPPGLQPAQSLKDEIATLRAEMKSMRTNVEAAAQPLPPREVPAAAEALLKNLLHRGMEEDLAKDAIDAALERAENATAPALMNALREVLAERVLTARAPWLPDRRRVIGLIGPTGVGKTTTLAKIAAHALQHGQKVALITIDTFRIGASEQLCHYGNIMKVPSFVARNRAELEQAVMQCSRVDLVLIDTAGCSDKKGVERQAEMVRSIAGAQLHLVCSAASGPRDLAATVERYRHLAPERLMLTKLDEAACPAAFLSASFRLSRPISAMTNGQRVPEDIRAPSTPELVELLIGGMPVMNGTKNF